mmetsp:Transcript_2562/g.4159  ORF Transcript_2562/g.4159 Transcript_2562/m.4159 type:complete len:981 (-) Transcript_2562:689-3631(-)
MITSWKQTKTSFEGAIKEAGSGGKRRPKKKGPNGAQTADTDVIDIGCVFVQPAGNADSSFSDRNNPSSDSSKKKRRKQGGSGYADAASMDVEPVICLTSQHKVAVLGKTKDGNLVESKSRTYVTRPGAGSHFSLSSGASEDAFAGMQRLGAKYDPGSNMIYAIRNNGTEVAVWTAAPSSVISGPDDDKVDTGRVNGKKLDEVGANHNKKKRKVDQHDVDASRSSSNAIISQRLRLPKGKVALTPLTPFSITSTSNGKKPHLLVGASGCCDDGSIWIAIRSVHGTSSAEPFILTIVDGSSFTQSETNSSRRSGKSRTGHGKWEVLDSRATCAVECQGRKGPTNEGVILRLCSVLYCEESGRLAHHQLHASISAKDGDWSISKVKKSTLIDLLQLPQTKRDVSAILDTSGCSITIVHRSDGEGWMLTSANVPQSDDTPTKSTFPLNCSSDESVFSFGNVFDNISAVLTRGNDTMTLKLVDFQRRAEISSVSLNRTLTGKKCLAMITNEMNGSVALLTSSEEPGSVELLRTTVDVGSNSQSIPVAKGTGTSLASTLRLAAQSSTSVKDFTDTLLNNKANSSFGVLVAGDTFTKVANSKSIDRIVDEACTFLVSAANSLIDGDHEEEAHAANGKRRKERQVKKNRENETKWDTVYRQGCAMIRDAQRGEECEPTKNGIKVHSSGESTELPKTFVDVAFRESARLLLSSKKELRKDVLPVLVSVLGTQLVSAREDYGIEAQEHVLLHTLNCAEDGDICKLDLVDAVLNNVRDIPEALLVSILRFVLRNVNSEDALAHYKKSSEQSKSSKQSARNVSNGKASTRLLSEIILDYTSTIVTNSKCNHSFLTKAIQDSFRSSVEVETILIILSNLLKSGNMHVQDSHDRISLTMGAIDWISAITDAHMGTVVKITSEGGLVVDKMQRVIRSVMSQSEFANELRELTDHAASAASLFDGAAVAAAKSNIATEPNSGDTGVTPYSFERLAF